MASLKTILASRVPQAVLTSVSSEVVETNLRDGQIWAYTPNNYNGNFSRDVCWVAPGNGTAIIEIWGAGGSGGRGCCCIHGVPGNPGAYSKKTVTVAAGAYVCGIVGQSCGNANASYFPGCSTATCITICTAAGCICMCAQGGTGGTAYCVSGSSLFCCFVANSFCNTVIGAGGCGIICNSNGGNCARGLAYGGDVNCPGCFSCVRYYFCQPIAYYNTIHIAYPDGLFSTQGGWISFEEGCCYTDGQFSSLGPYSQAIMGMNGQAMGYNLQSTMHCWSGNAQCGCYEDTGCHSYLPPGFPGASGNAVSGQQSRGQRGGPGMLKITFIGS